MSNRSGIKRCCVATAVVVLLLALVLVILYFTVFKPKRPQVVAAPVTLRNVEFGLLPRVTVNVTLDVHVLVRNPNYASFQYDEATTTIYYRGSSIAEAVVPAGEIRARSSENVSASVDIEAAKVVSDLRFLLDVLSGSFNVTSTWGVHGRVILLKIFKLHASTSVSCEITVHVQNKRTATSSCKYKYKVRV